uniref:CHCH domain-containing protein n=1 Tax=Solanum lycopersicum TaxID=4081 RepID=A0A3Q7H0W1_SOLLC
MTFRILVPIYCSFSCSCTELTCSRRSWFLIYRWSVIASNRQLELLIYVIGNNQLGLRYNQINYSQILIASICIYSMLIFWCGKKTGMAFGSGNAVGHRIADAVFGPRVFKHEVQGADPAPSAASCAASMTAFQECLNINGGDLSKCQFYMNMV